LAVRLSSSSPAECIHCDVCKASAARISKTISGAPSLCMDPHVAALMRVRLAAASNWRAAPVQDAPALATHIIEPGMVSEKDDGLACYRHCIGNDSRGRRLHSEDHLPATDHSPINASCYSILKLGLHCLARADVAGIALLIGLRFLTGWALDLSTKFGSTLIV
jgi:hypothetical protein